MLLSPCRSPQLQKHSQPHRPRLHSGSHQLRARPGRPGFVQRAGPGDVRPTQAQVLGGGAETTAHDQESSQGLHSRRPEGNLELVSVYQRYRAYRSVAEVGVKASVAVKGGQSLTC